ncbi:MAG: ATP-binding protein [Gemmatimonadetes bacterium]|nr:ATP-binding protein [Gemmatimonadota bacterium]
MAALVGSTRIVLTGPECSGKTTLAAVLAAHFDAPWVPEAARRFVETVPGDLSAATVEPIARLAMRLEDDALRAAPPLLFRDTDLVSTVVYARHYYGGCPAWIEREALARRADLYLLGRPDLPWAPDGVRDRPLQREELFEEFARALVAIDARVVEVSGEGSARVALAERAVGALLAERGVPRGTPRR